MKLALAAVVMGSLVTAGIAQTNMVVPVLGTTQSLSVAAAPAVQKTWADTITFKGDLRYRNDAVNDDAKKDAGGDVYTRDRDRIRARLAAEAKVNEDAKAVIQLSTGQSDPISGNQTLTDGSSKKEMRLDQAYVDYTLTGDNPNQAHALGGKMKNPLITMPDDLSWDPDLTPEGLALKSQVGDGQLKLLANAGYFWVAERSDKSDSMLYAGQAAVKFDFTKTLVLTLGGSYYGFQNMQGYDVVDWESKNNSFGNSTVIGSISGSTTNKAWASEFTPVVYFASLDFAGAGLPLSFYAQELSNIDADQFDEGQMLGLSISKITKEAKSWEVGYSHSKLEKDATPGMFTDSDRWGGGTDGEGDRYYAKYGLMKNLQAGVTYLVGERKLSDTALTSDFDRLEIDLTASF